MNAKKPIGTVQALFMSALAVMADGIIILLTPIFGIGVIVAPFVNGATYFILALWMQLANNVNLIEGRAGKMVSFFGGMVIEITPLLGSLPALTASTMSTIYFVNKEIAGYNKKNRG